ncbi:hypothetical protein PM082_022023 [Marasmius tenuissimus]|nr:hypothetical protein PM082_022023 [Marasmius tenuissimus]
MIIVWISPGIAIHNEKAFRETILWKQDLSPAALDIPPIMNICQQPHGCARSSLETVNLDLGAKGQWSQSYMNRTVMNEAIPDYITKKPKLAEYLARYLEEEDKQASRKFNEDVKTWNQNQNVWIEERQEEIAEHIADWEKAKADAEKELEDWWKDRDGRMEMRRKQREAEEEEVRAKTAVPGNRGEVRTS